MSLDWSIIEPIVNGVLKIFDPLRDVKENVWSIALGTIFTIVACNNNFRAVSDSEKLDLKHRYFSVEELTSNIEFQVVRLYYTIIIVAIYLTLVLFGASFVADLFNIKIAVSEQLFPLYLALILGGIFPIAPGLRRTEHLMRAHSHRVAGIPTYSEQIYRDVDNTVLDPNALDRYRAEYPDFAKIDAMLIEHDTDSEHVDRWRRCVLLMKLLHDNRSELDSEPGILTEMEATKFKYMASDLQLRMKAVNQRLSGELHAGHATEGRGGVAETLANLPTRELLFLGAFFVRAKSGSKNLIYETLPRYGMSWPTRSRNDEILDGVATAFLGMTVSMAVCAFVFFLAARLHFVDGALIPTLLSDIVQDTLASPSILCIMALFYVHLRNSQVKKGRWYRGGTDGGHVVSMYSVTMCALLTLVIGFVASTIVHNIKVGLGASEFESWYGWRYLDTDMFLITLGYVGIMAVFSGFVFAVERFYSDHHHLPYRQAEHSGVALLVGFGSSAVNATLTICGAYQLSDVSIDLWMYARGEVWSFVYYLVGGGISNTVFIYLLIRLARVSSDGAVRSQ